MGQDWVQNWMVHAKHDQNIPRWALFFAPYTREHHLLTGITMRRRVRTSFLGATFDGLGDTTLSCLTVKMAILKNGDIIRLNKDND
jgi:adenosine deaminase